MFSLEMSKEQLVDRLLCMTVGIDSWKLQKGKLDDEEFAKLGKGMDELINAPIFIDDSVGASLPEVRAKARRLQMEHGLDMIVVDYLQLMTSGNSQIAANRVQEISEISRALKQLGRELQIPVLCLSQLSRAVEARPGKIPQLSDLRDSGSIDNAFRLTSDAGLFPSLYIQWSDNLLYYIYLKSNHDSFWRILHAPSYPYRE